MANTKTAQLDRDIAVALKQARIKNLFAWRPKLEESIVDVDEGRTSRATGKPVLVSRLDSPRGAYFIIDGHHRAIEASRSGKPSVAIEIDKYVPRIERAGDAYRSYVNDKVNVYDFIRRKR